MFGSTHLEYLGKFDSFESLRIQPSETLGARRPSFFQSVQGDMPALGTKPISSSEVSFGPCSEESGQKQVPGGRLHMRDDGHTEGDTYELHAVCNELHDSGAWRARCGPRRSTPPTPETILDATPLNTNCLTSDYVLLHTVRNELRDSGSWRARCGPGRSTPPAPDATLDATLSNTNCLQSDYVLFTPTIEKGTSTASS